jgi:UDP-N-acetylmuramoylalanine--D-glutamate ligase
MLETCEPACDIAVLWNIYTCHLDWHNDKFSVYEQAKLNILKNSSNRIISQDFSHYWQNLANVKYFWLDSEFSYTENYFIKGKDQLFPSNNLLLLWEHNKKNICSIVSILDIISKNNIKWNNDRFNNLIFWLEKTLKTFLGLPHRMELIANYNWITFIDDGISTTPESTIEAIKTFWSKINTLFLWWWDYWFTQESYNLLKKHIVYYDIKNLVLFPNTGLDIFNLNRDSQENNSNFQLKLDNKSINILFTDSMKKAVEFSYKNTGNNNICLMSCAAPSYSLWSWYEQKWEEFKNFIEQNKKENM